MLDECLIPTNFQIQSDLCRACCFSGSGSAGCSCSSCCSGGGCCRSSYTDSCKINI